MDKVVANLVIYDSIGGLAEILDMDYQDGKLKTLKVRWIVAAVCYSGSYIAKEVIENLYYGKDVVDCENIYQLNGFKTMSEDKIKTMRAIDYSDQLARTDKMIKAA